MVRQPRLAGFTLVELMITLAIASLLLLASMPFGMQWTDNNRQLQARGVLWEATGEARARAMRNPDGRAASLPVAAVYWTSPGDTGGRTLEVRDVYGAVWSGAVHNTITLYGLPEPEPDAPVCLAGFNSRGQLLPPSPACHGVQAVEILVRGENRGMADVSLY
ncbi:MAG TPA: prepilin-type N-terminal cleavage/methylation domain-containing protein [Candidatus Luteimonas excrementigallinarum]|nr:prepilin-type N-terminal cleavage/methylation domain-containing protein [Candidatus Luteimonas excrementigallinarum]